MDNVRRCNVLSDKFFERLCAYLSTMVWLKYLRIDTRFKSKPLEQTNSRLALFEQLVASMFRLKQLEIYTERNAYKNTA